MRVLKFLCLLFIGSLFFTACQKEFLYEEGVAKGTLKKDTTGECLPVLVNGLYQKDTLLNASNYAEVQVNITQPGTYNLRTDTVNGYSFSASGTAAIAGLTTIRLTGTGRPFAEQIDVFRVKFDSTGTSFCEINVIVGPNGGGGGGTPPANDSIVAIIDGVYKKFNVNDSAFYDNTTLPGYNILAITGENIAGDENFSLAVGKAGILSTGTYTLNQFPAAVAGAFYVTPLFEYAAMTDPTMPVQTPGFTITIATLTATKVTGTFSGRVYEDQGAGPGFKDVTTGVFSVTIYP